MIMNWVLVEGGVVLNVGILNVDVRKVGVLRLVTLEATVLIDIFVDRIHMGVLVFGSEMNFTRRFSTTRPPSRLI